jgi:ketosteroid isomerase-like protein
MRLKPSAAIFGCFVVIASSALAAGPVSTVDRFHAALKRGDTAAAAALLTDDALIFEQGGVERSKAEYAGHHLPADAKYSKAVASQLLKRTEWMEGNVAWVGSESRMTGSFRGKAIDRVSTETMVLHRLGGEWKIVHIHWSGAAASR